LKLIGCLLLLSGWLLVLAALVMLPGFAQRSAFIGAGLGVEILGMVLLTRRYMAEQRRAQ
jgi:low temperature requirement protein LtrA